MHGPREEVGGNRWPRLTLKITSSIGNKQLSSTPTPGKCWTPFGTKVTFLVSLWNTMKAVKYAWRKYILDSGRFLKQNDQYMW